MKADFWHQTSTAECWRERAALCMCAAVMTLEIGPFHHSERVPAKSTHLSIIVTKKNDGLSFSVGKHELWFSWQSPWCWRHVIGRFCFSLTTTLIWQPHRQEVPLWRTCSLLFYFVFFHQRKDNYCYEGFFVHLKTVWSAFLIICIF